MALAREAYVLADGVKERSPETASGLRKAAVAVPAHIAAALSDRLERRRHVSAACEALAAVAACAGRVPGESSRELIHRAETLALTVVFELDATGVHS